MSVKWHGAAHAPYTKEPKTLFCFEKDRVTNSAGVLQMQPLIQLRPRIVLRGTLGRRLWRKHRSLYMLLMKPWQSSPGGRSDRFLLHAYCQSQGQAYVYLQGWY